MCTKRMIKSVVGQIFIFTVMLFLASCSSESKSKSTKHRKTPLVGKAISAQNYSFDNPPKFRKDAELVFLEAQTEKILFEIDVEVASNDIERARGLMYRESMDENHGMLFLFEREELQSFYMRNTLIPLDIMYVNSEFEIVDIYENTKPMDESSLFSSEPVVYVVEINAGLSEKYGIKEGDFIRYN